MTHNWHWRESGLRTLCCFYKITYWKKNRFGQTLPKEAYKQSETSQKKTHYQNYRLSTVFEPSPCTQIPDQQLPPTAEDKSYYKNMRTKRCRLSAPSNKESKSKGSLTEDASSQPQAGETEWFTRQSTNRSRFLVSIQDQESPLWWITTESEAPQVSW